MTYDFKSNVSKGENPGDASQLSPPHASRIQSFTNSGLRLFWAVCLEYRWSPAFLQETHRQALGPVSGMR